MTSVIGRYRFALVQTTGFAVRCNVSQSKGRAANQVHYGFWFHEEERTFHSITAKHRTVLPQNTGLCSWFGGVAEFFTIFNVRYFYTK